MHPQHETALRIASPPVARAELYWHFAVDGASELAYDRICDQVGFPNHIAPGLLGHIAGPSPTGWELIDLWSSAESMEHVFSNYLVDAISGTIRRYGDRFDIEPETRAIARLIVGPAAADFSLEAGAREKCADRGVHPVAVVIEHLGGGEAEYLAGCELLDIPRKLPEGLIVHMAGPSKDGWRVFDCWDSAAHADAWGIRVREAIAEIDADSGIMASARIRRFEPVRAFVVSELAGGGHLPSGG